MAKSSTSTPLEWAKVKKYFCSALGTSIILGLIALLDPLGATTAAEHHSESAYQRLFAGPWYKSVGQAAITVVLIDDQYLLNENSSWPLSYAKQELLLESISDFRPASVFLDIVHLHKHNASSRTERGLQQLSDRIKQMTLFDRQSVSVPILIKDKRETNSCGELKSIDFDVSPLMIESDITKQLIKAGATPSYIGWNGCKNRYPAYVFAEESLRTPAYTLFKTECLKRGSKYPGCLAREIGLIDGLNDQAMFSDPMMIRWGTASSSHNAQAFSAAGLAECGLNSKSSFFSRALYSAWQLLRTLWGTITISDKRGKSEPCPYIDTVPASYLLDSNGVNQDWLTHMLRDRVVLIGTQIEAAHDMATNPINGQLPAVYLLAMALDNYLEFGPGYYKDLSLTVLALLQILTLFLTFFAINLLFSAYSSSKYRRPQALSEQQTARLDLCAVFIFKLLLPILISLFVAIAAFRIGGASFNWIAIALLSFLFNPVALADCNGDSQFDFCVLIKNVFAKLRMPFKKE